MLNREKFITLLEKYAIDKISEEERSEFMQSVTSGLYDDLILQHIENNLQNSNANLWGANLPPQRSADMMHKIISSEKQNSRLIIHTTKRTIIRHWFAAAAIIGIVFLAAHFIYTTSIHNNLPIVAFAKNSIKKINNSRQPVKMVMEDGSIITLQPASSIRYPTHFLPEKREILLEGEAFFEVKRNVSRPFFVYNKNIVTHVLGTSFNVKLNSTTQQLEVSVRSGRVEVYENKPAEFPGSNKKNNGVILLPNQRVIYDQNTRQFVPSLVDIPLPVINETAGVETIAPHWEFENTPLDTVLASLEKIYGIEIVVEKESIYQCLFTGDISQQDLYSKLDIICQSVQASYEIKGTRILIKGNGCN